MLFMGCRGSQQPQMVIAKLLFALLFALLVSNGAGSLASGLARGLAFAAAAFASALLEGGFCDSLNEFHSNVSFLIRKFLSS